MTTDTFTLTDIERACGVTIDQVRAARARALLHMTRDGLRVVVDRDMSPALASAVARMALGAPAMRHGANALGFGVYGIAP